MSKVTRTFSFDGKRYYVYGETEEEVQRKMTERIKSLESQTDPEMTLNEWAEVCLRDYKHFKTVEYERTYRYRINSCILKVIGNKKLTQIKPIDCQRCMNLQDGKSKYQITQTKQMMDFLFENAIENDMIEKNPARRITSPNGSKTKRRSMTKEEHEAFLSIIDNSDYLVFALMYFLGLRPEEARTVKRADIIDRDNYKTLRIVKSKSENGKREIPIPIYLSELMQKSVESEYIAPRGNGKQHTDSSFYEAWKRLKKDMNNDDETFVPYVLRHSFATGLQNKKVSVSVAQKILGHSKPELTIEWYQHVDYEAMDELAEILECGTGDK